MIHPLSLAALQVARFTFWAHWSTGARFVALSFVCHTALVVAILRGSI